MTRLERRNRRARYLVALLVALTVHGGVLFVLSLLPGSSAPPPQHTKKEKRFVVSQWKRRNPTPPTKSTQAPDTERVSTENANPKEETLKRTPQKRARRAPRKNAHRPPKRTPTPAIAPKKAPKENPQEPPTPKETPLKRGEVVVRSGRPNENPPNHKREPAQLIPSDSALDRVLGISSEERLPGVRQGSQTALKSKKWVGASFFLRVRDAVRQVWDPGAVYRRHDPDGSFYGFKNWFTVLHVTLDAQGRIRRLIIQKPSGLRFLDREALRAFRAAGPFPNPPQEILSPKTGLLRFRFGFLVEVNTNLSFKLFRF